MNKGLETIKDYATTCTRCKLHSTRNNVVFGSGSEDSRWLILGEGPGRDEDACGLPFVGKAGKLLNLLLEELGWNRDSVYVTNTVKCWPPGNRNPEQDELKTCYPYLEEQLLRIRPIVITTLGKVASNHLLKCSDPMKKMRGNISEIDILGFKCRVVPTYHPSYIQRGNWKSLELMKQDMATAVAILMDSGVLPPELNKS